MNRVATGDPRAAVAFHDAECGGYAADLALWEELAADCGSPMLELGAGTGRVALHLAQRGHEVVAVERDEVLAAAAEERVDAAAATVAVVRADARELRLDRRFALVLAPMQLLQLLGGRAGRLRALRRIGAHLAPGGLVAAAIVEGAPEGVRGRGPAPIPDIREHDGWTYSSLPLGAEPGDGVLRISRLRQAVSPAGELTDELDVLSLDRLDAQVLEAELAAAGLSPAGRRQVGATDSHVGSTVVLAEAPR